MRKLLAKFGIIQLVWTEDFDGELRLRRVYWDGPHAPTCKGILTYTSEARYHIKLKPNGVAESKVASYVRRWYNYSGNRRPVIVEQ